MVAVLVAAAVAAYALTRGEHAGRAGERPAISIGAGAGPGTMVDLGTGDVTPLPASIATAGTYYAVSPDQTTVAYSTCCDPRIRSTWRTSTGRRCARSPRRGGRLRRTVVPGRLDARVSATGRLDPAAREPGRPGRPTGQRTQVTHFEAQPWDWWFTFPSFAPDGQSILFQLPRGEPDNPIWDLWSVPVAGGKQTLVHRNAGWGGYSPDGKRLAYLSPMNGPTSPEEGSGSRASTGNTPSPGPQGSQVGAVVPGWDADLLLGRRIDLRAGRRDRFGHEVAAGGTAEWFDDHTLIVGTGGRSPRLPRSPAPRGRAPALGP